VTSPTRYVTDTHSLLWHLYDLPQLGPNARTAFDVAGAGDATLLIPAIVLAEIIHVVERRRHDIDVAEALDKIARAENYQVLPFDLAGARSLIPLTAIAELHDRMIVAAALAHDAPLITRDRVIAASGLVSVVW
jgi:predicted nucleic acid-binding protein